MKKIIGFGISLLAFLMSVTPCFAATYEIDPAHSSVSFRVRHLISNVQGSFREFRGTVEYDPEKPDFWQTEAVIKIESIDTNVAERDKHLRSPDFFDAVQFPEMTFKSTHATEVTESSAKLHGVLKMHGVEKPVTLDLRIYGSAQDPWGHTRVAFEAQTTVNRKDFGIVYNQALDNGAFLIGDEVAITIDVEAMLKDEA